MTIYKHNDYDAFMACVEEHGNGFYQPNPPRHDDPTTGGVPAPVYEEVEPIIKEVIKEVPAYVVNEDGVQAHLSLIDTRLDIMNNKLDNLLELQEKQLNASNKLWHIMKSMQTPTPSPELPLLQRLSLLFRGKLGK